MILEHPIMVGAGIVKTVEDVVKFSTSSVSAIVLGSITIEQRSGNVGNVYYEDAIFTLNALGLPNPGYDYYKRYLPEIRRLCDDNNKRLILSVAGFSKDEYIRLVYLGRENNVDIVELNLSCPNVWDNNEQHEIFCFNISLVQEICRGIGREGIGLKVTPFSNPLYLSQFSSAMEGLIEYICCCNTFPNAMSGRINTPLGLAGLAGPALKPISLGQIVQYHEKNKTYELIGAGGISSGMDVVDFLQAGAIAVQINSAYQRKGLSVFTDILTEYLELIE